MQQITDNITNYDNIKITIRLRENGPKERIIPGKRTTISKNGTITKPKKNY